MKITDIKIGHIAIPLNKTFVTSLRTISTAELVVVKIETDIGIFGFGDAPSSGAITGDTINSISAAIDQYIKPKFLGRTIDSLNEALLILDQSLLNNHVAKAAVDIALYDLFSKSIGIPLYKYLGGSNKVLTTNMTIGIASTEVMVKDSIRAVERGFNDLKIKVGLDTGQDIERLKSIRNAVGPKISLRIDANQAWSPKEAIKILNKMEMEGLDIELIEQPVKAWDIEGLKRVTDSVNIIVMADESAYSVTDTLRVLKMGAADMLNIKLMKAGGIHNAINICTIAEAFGVPCLIGSMLESKISVTAAVHLAMSKSIITKIDLDGPLLFSDEPIIGGAFYSESQISVHTEPGLGINSIRGVNWCS